MKSLLSLFFFALRGLLRWGLASVVIVGLLFAFATAWMHLASRFYTQEDDLAQLASKRAYLKKITTTGLQGGTPPNIVLILFDDLGYGDVGAYGSRAIQTPQIDRLAAGGVLLTDYYAPAPVCSPSRAGLLTGRYPPRTRMVQVPMTPDGSGDSMPFNFPAYELQRAANVVTRLPSEEITLAEVLRAAGYATAIVGKWHLGATSPSLPNERGFDHFEGLLSSNDQLPNPYYRDDEIVEASPVDQTTLTERYTRSAVRFIEAHTAEPFFLYIAHTFPHRPLHASAEQRGKSQGGLYGDVVEDLDRSVGQVMEALRRAGVERRTLVIVTSDNGPWFQGSPGLHRGRKTHLFDGGFAVPFIAHWPGTLPAGAVRDEMAMGIDVFPTVLALAGLPLPGDREIDGRDILPLLRDGAPSPHESLFFYWTDTLGAVRSGNLKYHIRRPVSVGYAPVPIGVGLPKGPWLFDLGLDSDESYDVSHNRPEDFQRLARMLADRRELDQSNPRGFR